MATKLETPTTTTKVAFPPEVDEYIKSKVQTNGSGGRPHLLKQVSEEGLDPKDVLLEIIERTWIHSKSISSTAKRYNIVKMTIYRMLQDLKPFQDILVQYLEQTPRRKVFYNKATESSGYETVQAYIRRAIDPLDPVRSYRKVLKTARTVWTYLKYKDPTRWTKQDVASFLGTKSDGAQSNYLDAIRAVAPQIGDKSSPHYIKTGIVRRKLNLRKKDIFGKETKLIIDALEEVGLKYHSTIFRFHITGAFREGKDGKAGLTGISWDRFHKDFTRVDDYETKVGGGVMWENCPVDLFWKTLPKELKEIWSNRGKPVTEHVILGGYSELTKIYKEIRKALAEHFKDKIDPDLFKEFTTIRPHDADKIHCNLLWEAGIPVEVVAGMNMGRGRAKGLVGRGWFNTNTITKHYLSLAEKSQKFQELIQKVTDYSHSTFNGGQ